jgi:hypothetical protein
MNKRIKELAEQAGGGLSCIAEPLEHPWKFSESELEKFAELIVQECASKVDWILAENGRTQGDLIKRHFGVE